MNKTILPGALLRILWGWRTRPDAHSGSAADGIRRRCQTRQGGARHNRPMRIERPAALASCRRHSGLEPIRERGRLPASSGWNCGERAGARCLAPFSDRL